jgi:hypothetical protein
MVTLLIGELAPNELFTAWHDRTQQAARPAFLTSQLLENPGLVIGRRWVELFHHLSQDDGSFAGALEPLQAFPQAGIVAQQL